MSKQIQYCTCKVNLAGQNCHTVIYGEHNPVTWPEVQVLQALHGDENVMDIMPVSLGQVWPTEEKNRLMSIYGYKVVEACFPGRAFRMDYMMTEDTALPYHMESMPDLKAKAIANGNGDDEDDDDSEDEVAKAKTQLEPIFKPSPRGRRTPPPPPQPEHKEAS
jgi:hypothetical protein